MLERTRSLFSFVLRARREYRRAMLWLFGFICLGCGFYCVPLLISEHRHMSSMLANGMEVPGDLHELRTELDPRDEERVVFNLIYTVAGARYESERKFGTKSFEKLKKKSPVTLMVHPDRPARPMILGHDDDPTAWRTLLGLTIFMLLFGLGTLVRLMLAIRDARVRREDAELIAREEAR